MGVTNRQLILDDLNTVLSALVGDETALVELGKVERCLRAWDDPKINPLPWVGFCSTRAAYTHEPFGHMVAVMEVDVWGHIAALAADDLEDRTDKASDLEDMLIAVIMADPTRGGNAISTTLKDSYSDDGHPDYDEPGNNVFTVTQRWEVKYLRTTAQTTE